MNLLELGQAEGKIISRRLAWAQLVLQSYGFSVWYRGGIIFSLMHLEIDGVTNMNEIELVRFAAELVVA